jgi:hypothetical protein
VAASLPWRYIGAASQDNNSSDPTLILRALPLVSSPSRALE